eukprot:Hpha_TRINITY_DN16975_c2_g8::TRINITY_DN16975_c2_g8_i1::g.54453::m.54453
MGWRLAVLLAVILGVEVRAQGVSRPEQYVNTLQGTWSLTEYSTGGTLPLVGRPWGMTNWAPHTNDLYAGSRWFHPEHRRFFGVRATHQPSPWIGDYGYFWIQPQVGQLLQPGRGYCGYDPRHPDTTFGPHLFEADLFMFDTKVSVTATRRAAVLRFQYPPHRDGPANQADQSRRLLFYAPNNEKKDFVEAVGDEVYGWTYSNSGGVHSDFRMYFHAKVSKGAVKSAKVDMMNCGSENSNQPVQLTRLDFWKDGVWVDTTGANATNPGGNCPEGEGPDKAFDGKDDTKWLDFSKQPLYLHFPSPVSPDSFSLTTANDHPERDPVQWVVAGSNDGQHWETLQSQQTDYPVPSARRAQTPVIGFTSQGSFTHLRFSTHKVRAQATDTSCPAGILEIGDAPGGETVEVVVGTSFISLQQAKANADEEVGGRAFSEVLQESVRVWREQLGRVNITRSGLKPGSPAEKERLSTFYGSLYRASMFPHRLTEYQNGLPVHYSPYTGRVAQGVLSTDHGFWDAYRTVYPLHNFLFSDTAGELLQGFINAYKEGGWLPSWPSPGFRGSMVGSFQDLVLADAMVKGIQGFNYSEAYEGMLRDADVDPGKVEGAGRFGLEKCLALGYCPHDTVHESVARTLNYAYADWGIAQAARLMKRSGDVSRFSERALHYRNMFDHHTKFNRERWANGSFVEPFDQYAWSGGYTEGGPWTFRFEAVWDMEGMAKLFGGKKKLCKMVDKLLAEPPRYSFGSYGMQIHEQVELPLEFVPVPGAEKRTPFPPGAERTGFGQLEHNNQPSHHILYIPQAAGCSHTTEVWTRQVLDKLYSSTHFSGDEDNGEMGAWYVFSSLGFYPLVPGTDSYVTGSPLFDEARVTLGNGKTLNVVSHGNSDTAVLVRRVALNGKKVDKAALEYHGLMEGGTLEFWMREEGLGGRLASTAVTAVGGVDSWRTLAISGWCAFAIMLAKYLRRGDLPPAVAAVKEGSHV